MTRKNPLHAACAVVIAFAICTSTSWAARVEPARLTHVENKVSIVGQSKDVGVTVAAGQMIVTGPRSRAELTLPNGTVVRVGQGSSFSFTGSKLVLSQGSGLLKVVRKNSTVVTPSQEFTGGPAVISAHASKGYEGLFVLEGRGAVNGTTLIAGEAWVRENGKARKFAFDLKKMVATSSLVTKFPQAPWVAQTTAVATLQHQLLAANRAESALLGRRGQAVAFTFVAASAQQVGAANGTRNLIASSSSVDTASGAAAGIVKTGAGTLVVNGSNTITSAATMNVSSTNGGSTSGVVTTGAGMLALNGSNSYTGATTINGGSLSLGSGGSATITYSGNHSVNAILVQQTTGISGTLVVTGAGGSGTSGSATAINTLNVASGGTLSGVPANFANVTFQPRNNIVFAGVTLPQQAGQTVTINGVNYVSTLVSGAGGSLRLQPVAH